MVYNFYPSDHHPVVPYNTRFSPQSTLHVSAPPVQAFNELIEEVALTFDTCLHEETIGVFGDMIIDETGRLNVYDNEVAEEVAATFDNMVIEEIASTFNNMAILETA
jgi:hypothetical protein